MPMHRKLALVIAAFVFASPTAFADDRPDPTKTPGAILGIVPDDQVASCLSDKTGTNVQVNDPITIDLICTSGYSKCIRNVPQAEKTAVYQSYGLIGNHTSYCDTKQGCEVDHLISLELGGSNDQTNLWPQPYQGTTWNAHVKDQLENHLHAQVCTGNIALDQAQQEIAKDWIASYQRRLGNH
jgi:hypothetical protein